MDLTPIAQLRTSLLPFVNSRTGFISQISP